MRSSRDTRRRGTKGLFLIAILAVLAGCAAARGTRFVPSQAKARLTVVVPRSCMEEIRLSEDAECRGPDLEHLKCKGFVLKKKQGCETTEVEKEKE